MRTRTHGVVERRGWTAGTMRGGVGHLGLTHAARQVVGDRRAAEVRGQQKPSNDPRNNQHNPRYTNYGGGGLGTKLMWTNLEALPRTKYFLQF